MDFDFDPTTLELRERLTTFMETHVYPAEKRFEEQLGSTPDSWNPPPIMEELKEEARRQGLWNLFLPGESGAGLTNLQYAPLCEILSLIHI